MSLLKDFRFIFSLPHLHNTIVAYFYEIEYFSNYKKIRNVSVQSHWSFITIIDILTFNFVLFAFKLRIWKPNLFTLTFSKFLKLLHYREMAL